MPLPAELVPQQLRPGRSPKKVVTNSTSGSPTQHPPHTNMSLGLQLAWTLRSKLARPMAAACGSLSLSGAGWGSPAHTPHTAHTEHTQHTQHTRPPARPPASQLVRQPAPPASPPASPPANQTASPTARQDNKNPAGEQKYGTSIKIRHKQKNNARTQK